jgi:hypothetical protein
MEPRDFTQGLLAFQAVIFKAVRPRFFSGNRRPVRP